jgi:hypothetical protein
VFLYNLHLNFPQHYLSIIYYFYNNVFYLAEEEESEEDQFVNIKVVAFVGYNVLKFESLILSNI